MNQQQGSQESSNQSINNGEQRQGPPSPWLIRGKRRIHEGPKSEHPSTYDESIPPLSYRAQDHRQASSSSPQAEASSAGTQGTSSNAEAPKRAYRPSSRYSEGWQVPSWARPQQNHFGVAWLFIVVTLAILFFPMLGFLIYALIHLIAVIAIILLIVVIVVGILLLAFAIMVILWVVRKIDRIRPPSWW